MIKYGDRAQYVYSNISPSHVVASTTTVTELASELVHLEPHSFQYQENKTNPTQRNLINILKNEKAAFRKKYIYF